jgi:manganese/zinc/iron transport system substrate-binding protein
MRHAPAWSRLPGVFVVAIAFLIGACERAPSGSASTPGGPGPRPRVVATTGMIADAAREIAGDAAEVTALMGPGVDPHLYKASPGDIRALELADLVLYNGLHLEGKLADVLERLGRSKACIAVAGGLKEASLRSTGQGVHDPHVWFDAALWAEAAIVTGDALAGAIPAERDRLIGRARTYADRLLALDAWCKAQLATIPPSRRVLVTSHDAFGYFGRAYGLRVLAVQGISTESEASLKDVNSLVDTLVADAIPAVFIESSVSPRTIEALIEGAKVRGHTVLIGGELFSDALGQEGTPEGTYVGMVIHNVKSIVVSLGGQYAEPPMSVTGGR